MRRVTQVQLVVVECASQPDLELGYDESVEIHGPLDV
jgi:hypothetical protein